MAKVRPGKWLTQEDKNFFMRLTPKEVTKRFLQDIFSDKYNLVTNKKTESRFNTYDQFELKAGEYHNKEKIVTNCGIFIYNKRCLEETFLAEVGYQNVELTKKRVGKINEMLAQHAAKSKESLILYVDYLNKLRWLGDCIHSDICAPISIKSFKPLPKVQKRKKELLKKYEKEIAAKDLKTIDNITSELLAMAKEELKDDSSYEMYASGARGSFDNAYRRMQIMNGPVYNPSKGEYDIITNSLYEGYTKEDIATIANNLVQIFYNKSIGPGDSGYLTKQISAGFQTVMLDEKGSDCGTKGHIKFVLTEQLAELYMYSYMVEGSKLVELNPENVDKYVGKPVKMRDPSYCIGDCPCNACAGNRFYIEGLKKIGLTMSAVSGVFLNGNMKGAHDATIRLTEMSLDEMMT